MRQLISPNLDQKDSPGWCLRFTRNSFNKIASRWDYARQAWDNSPTKHTSALPGDVSVPVWFDWWGTIDGKYGNYGDVAIWVPGRGVFGTPLKKDGFGNRWDASVEARAVAIGGKAKYLGWTEDVNGVRVVEPSPVVPPQPTPTPPVSGATPRQIQSEKAIQELKKALEMF